MNAPTNSQLDEAELALDTILTLAGVGAIGIPVAKFLKAAIEAWLLRQSALTSAQIADKLDAFDKRIADVDAKIAAEIKAKWPNG